MGGNGARGSFIATVALAIGLVALPASAVAAAGKQQFPVIDRAPGEVSRGSIVSLTFDPGRGTRCRVAFHGPGDDKAGPFSRVVRGGLQRLSWRVPFKATAGMWKVRVRCREESRIGAATAHLRLRGRGGHKSLVARGTVSWRNLRTPGAPAVRRGRQDRLGAGRGAGRNPFEYGQCTYHAYERRPDVYETAVSRGQPRGGWNGYVWADRAAAVGFPVGTTPVVGALAVFSRQYYGGPRNDGRGGQYGHVAYVVRVGTGGRFVVTERNVRGKHVSEGSYVARTGIRFVYGGPAGNGPGSPPPPADGGSDFNNDGRVDIFAVNRTDSGSGRTAVHVLNGANNFQAPSLLSTGTWLHQTDAQWDFSTGDFNKDGRVDIFAVNRTDSGSGKTAVHVLNGANNFQSSLLSTGTWLHQTDAKWSFVVG